MLIQWKGVYLGMAVEVVIVRRLKAVYGRAVAGVLHGAESYPIAWSARRQ